MPALFGYLVVIGLLLGGGYGALNWLAAPEPVKVATKAAHNPSPSPRFPPGPEVKSSDSASATPSPFELNEKSGSNDRSSSAQPQAHTAAEEQSTHAGVSAPAEDGPSLSTDVQTPPVGATEAGHEASDGVRATTANAPSTEATKPTRKMALASPGDAQAASSTAPVTATKTAKRRNVRQASRHQDDHHYNDRRYDHYNDHAEQFDRHSAEQHPGSAGQQYGGESYRGQQDYLANRPLALMTLRTIEFPDGRRVSQLVPYRRTPYRMISHPAGDRVPRSEPDE
jgi:hypothetical protein